MPNRLPTAFHVKNEIPHCVKEKHLNLFSSFNLAVLAFQFH